MLIRRWTMVGDRVIHSRETDDASNRGTCPLVFLHGVGTTSRYVRPLLRKLDGHAAISAPELPGIGSSSKQDPPRDVAGQADIVAAWLRTTGRHPAVLVGNSMGAQTAVEVAIRHAVLVERLVLIGPTIDPAARGLLRQLGRLLVDATRERPSLIVLSVSDSFLTRRLAVLRYARASLEHHIEERVPLLDVPVLVIRGEFDPLVPHRWARELAAVAPQARRIEIPGAAHACHHGRPELVAEILLEAIAGS